MEQFDPTKIHGFVPRQYFVKVVYVTTLKQCWQTMSPVRIQIAISYRNPGPLNLWDHHLGSNLYGSMILKSIPSRVISGFLKRFRNSYPNYGIASEVERDIIRLILW